MSALREERIAVLGLGLIGSSLARAIRARGGAAHISGHARSEATRCAAKRLGFCDTVHEKPEDAVVGASMVVLCTPVGAFKGLLQRVAPALANGAIVTDVGGVKGAVIEHLEPLIPGHCHLVPGHPIAGTEHSGPESGFAELFDGRWCILTPTSNTDPDALGRVRRLWETVGSRVAAMTPEHHDQALSIISHLPHAIAYVMVGVADDVESVSKREVIRYSASGFRDFTRIAASEPEMWRDIFLANRNAILEGMGRFAEELFTLQRAIRWGDGELLEAYFRRGHAIRRGIIGAGQDAEGAQLYLTRSGIDRREKDG